MKASSAGYLSAFFYWEHGHHQPEILRGTYWKLTCKVDILPIHFKHITDKRAEVWSKRLSTKKKNYKSANLLVALARVDNNHSCKMLPFKGSLKPWAALFTVYSEFHKLSNSRQNIHKRFQTKELQPFKSKVKK